MKHNIENIVHQTLLIAQKEKVLRKEKYKRGECFNIFEIMHAQSDEVTTHSAMLASLLNTKGSHGAGCVFLDLFIDIIIFSIVENKNYYNSFHLNTANAHVKVEYPIGGVTYQYEEGGRIDILIEDEDSSKAIIIENKIYAGDQHKQLYRYYKFAEERYGNGNYLILYLTLDGHIPSEESIKGDLKKLENNKDFYCISYEDDIVRWITACKEKAVSRPIVRETITQYLDLILKLTNQNMESTTKDELVSYLSSGENIVAAYNIHKVYYDVLNKMCDNVLRQQVEEIAKEMELCYKFPDNKDWCKRWEGQFFFYKANWESFCIGFEFMSDGLRNFNYGYRYQNENKRGSKEDVKNQLYGRLGGTTNPWWAGFKPFPIHDWNNDSALTKLYDGTIKSLIKEKTNDLLNLSTDIKL